MILNFFLTKEDVYDRSVWREDDNLMNHNAIGIGLFVDGISPFHSSRISFWIAYAFVLNLPPEDRLALFIEIYVYLAQLSKNMIKLAKRTLT